MRRTLITLLILVACVIAGSVLWIFGGRQLSLFIDRFGTVETASARINSITYEGSGTGGILRVNDLALSLNAADSTCSTPNIGSTKDGQLALAAGGKVFAFGPPRSERKILLPYRRRATMLRSHFGAAFLVGRRRSTLIS